MYVFRLIWYGHKSVMITIGCGIFSPSVPELDHAMHLRRKQVLGDDMFYYEKRRKCVQNSNFGLCFVSNTLPNIVFVCLVAQFEICISNK